MVLRKNKLIHIIVILSIVLGSAASTIAQVAANGQDQALQMQICSSAGGSFIVDMPIGGHDVVDDSQPCPYCIAHGAITPAINTNLTFEAPQTLALLPALFYQSPKPLAVWVTPPSAVPPTQA